MKICMFVWNNFTSDARVMREASALAYEGHEVHLIAVRYPYSLKLPKEEIINNGIRVHRVRKYPLIFIMVKEMLTKYKNNLSKWLFFFSAFLFFILMLLMLFDHFALTIFFLLGLTLMMTNKFISIASFLNVSLLMTLKGFFGRYDVYHAHDLNTLPQATLCSILKHKKLIYDSHEVQTSRSGYKGPWFGWLERFLLVFVDRMIMTTHTRAKYTEKRYGISPVVVHNYSFYINYNKVKKFDLYEHLAINPKKKILLYQGGVQVGRGLETLIKAVPFVKEDGVFVFVGPTFKGFRNRLKRLVEKLQVNNRVYFIDKVPLYELPTYTKNAYIGFQLLHNTNFNHYSALSNKLFEYMMMHVPVVTCDLPEIEKIVNETKIGIATDCTCEKNLAKAINRFLEDEKFHAECVKHCQSAKHIYNWEQEKHTLIELYNGILEKQHKSIRRQKHSIHDPRH
ncbi:glycosyltransferase [Haloplasma contractile]|nr:glycosyltransferase [Haloplasma contractile]